MTKLLSDSSSVIRSIVLLLWYVWYITSYDVITPLGCSGGLHITVTSLLEDEMTLNCTSPGATKVEPHIDWIDCRDASHATHCIIHCNGL